MPRREHLARHRGASQHTCDSYAYSFQSLFEFAARRLKTAPSALMLEQLDATLIGAFLEHLENARRNSAQTRNIRLAAIRSFFRFLQHREPAALDQIRRILAIPFKKTDTRLVAHLDKDGAPSFARCAGSGHPRRNSRSGHAPSGGLRWAAGLGTDGVVYRRCCCTVQEHSRAWKGPSRESVAALEANRLGIAGLVGRARHGRHAGSVRQRARRALQSLGSRVRPSAPRRHRESSIARR